MLRRTKLFFGSVLLIFLLVRAAEHEVSHDYNEAFEAICLNGSLAFANAEPLYPQNSARPFSVYVHSPLGAVIGGAIVKLMPHAFRRTKILVIRLISLTALLAALTLLWRRVVYPNGVSLLAYLVALGFGMTQFADYATTGRNDMLSMLAEIGTLALFLAWTHERKTWRLALFALGAIVSVYTRQMGIAVAGAAILTLLRERRARDAAAAVAMMVIPAAALFVMLNRETSGAFFLHLIEYNLRPYQTVFTRNSLFFQPAMCMFFGSYIFFWYLTAQGYWRARREIPVLAVALPLSLLLSLILFCRGGGDVNYFFEPILLAIFFAARGWESIATRRWVPVIAIVQVLVILAVLASKTVHAWPRTFFPNEDVAQTIRAEFPGGGLVVGSNGDSLIVHLRGWAVHGPDVTTGAPVAYYCLPRTNWIFEMLKSDFETGRIAAVVLAQPGCRDNPPYLAFPKGIGTPEHLPERLLRDFDNTVCVYGF